MKYWNRWKTLLVVTCLVIGGAVLLLPTTSFGDPEAPDEHWVRSPEAIARDNTCAGVTLCYQKCFDFQGNEHLMPYFECF